MKAARDRREGVPPRAHVHDVERDLLVDWGRDRVTETGIKLEYGQGSTPLR